MKTESVKSSSRSDLVPGFIAGAIVVLAFVSFLFLSVTVRMRGEAALADAQLRAARDRVQMQAVRSVEVSARIASLVARNPSITPSELEELTTELSVSHPSIASYAAAPNATIAWSKRNSGSIFTRGDDLLASAETRRAVADSIDRRAEVASLPAQAAGPGLAGARYIKSFCPVFVKDKSVKRLWGIVAVAIDIDKLMANSGVSQKSGSLEYALIVPQWDVSSPALWGNRDFSGNAAGKSRTGNSKTRQTVTVQLQGVQLELQAYRRVSYMPTMQELLVLVAGLASAAFVVLTSMTRGKASKVIEPSIERLNLLSSTASELSRAIDSDARLASSVQDDSGYTPDYLVPILARDLGESASFETGEFPYVDEDIDLRRIVADLESCFVPLSESAGLAFQTSVESVVPKMMRGKGQAVSRILSCLLGEAFAATESGEVSLSVITEESRKGQSWIRFIVRDSGNIPDPDHFEELFLPFTDYRNAAGRRTVSTGLSMYLASSIVSGLGSRLECEAGSDRGLMFRFSLPFALPGGESLSSGSVQAESGDPASLGESRVSERGGDEIPERASRARHQDSPESSGTSVQDHPEASGDAEDVRGLSSSRGAGAALPEENQHQDDSESLAVYTRMGSRARQDDAGEDRYDSAQDAGDGVAISASPSQIPGSEPAVKSARGASSGFPSGSTDSRSFEPELAEPVRKEKDGVGVPPPGPGKTAAPGQQVQRISGSSREGLAATRVRHDQGDQTLSASGVSPASPEAPEKGLPRDAVPGSPKQAQARSPNLQPVSPASPVSSGVRPAQAERRYVPRILLAEDGEVNREIILRMLRSRSYDADVVTDGRQALAAALKNEYEIIFMDCSMPVMDGFESTSKIRQLKGPGRPAVVGMTTSVREAERERCFSCGMDDVIAKPFTLDELVSMVRKYSEPD